MHDLVIRNGIVVDGTGSPQRIADIAVDGETITAVGDDVGRRPPGDRRPRAPGHARIRGRAHALRRPGHLGSLPHALVLPRRDHRHLRQLRRGLRPGAAGRLALPDQPDGGRRGHPRHRAGRGRQVQLGILPRLSGRARQGAQDHGHRRAGAARCAALLRDGRARGRPQRPADRRRDRAHGRSAGAGAARPARSASRLRARSSTRPRTAASRPACRHANRSCSVWPRR